MTLHKCCIFNWHQCIRLMLCYVRDFAQFYNPLHGNCYVYNSGWNSSIKLKTSTKSGRLHGQKMTVSILNKAVIDRTLRPLYCHLWSYFKHTSLSCRYIHRDIMCKHDDMNIQHAHRGLVGAVSVSPLACNGYSYAPFIAKSKAACGLCFDQLGGHVELLWLTRMHDVIHITGSTQHIATPPEEDRATAT